MNVKMESVKILITNNTRSCGKSTLSLALACHICEESSFEPIQTTLFDCSEIPTLFNKRKEDEQLREENQSKVGPYEILSLPMQNESLYRNTLDSINYRKAAYIFDLPYNCTEPDLFQLTYYADIIICPLIISAEGIGKTEKTLEFISNSVNVFREIEKEKTIPEFFIVPNMVRPSWNNPNISQFWKQISNIKECKVTPNIPWRENLLNELSTYDKVNDFDEIFAPAFEPIYESIKKIYHNHYDGK